MARKLFLAAALVLVGLLGAGAAQAQNRPAKRPARMRPPFVHAVIFHLKKDAPKSEADDLIRDARRMLGRIPTVRGLWVGKPDTGGAGPFNKKFDVGLLVLFEDADGLKTYIDSKQHKDFVKKHEKYIDREKLSVFDFRSEHKERAKAISE
jgi:hypothetical protein